MKINPELAQIKKNKLAKSKLQMSKPEKTSDLARPAGPDKFAGDRFEPQESTSHISRDAQLRRFAQRHGRPSR